MSAGKFDHRRTGVNGDLSETIQRALRLPDRPASRWHRAGISRRAERLLDAVGVVVLTLFTVGWSWSIAEARVGEVMDAPDARPTTVATSTVMAALTEPNARSTAYLTDMTLRLLDPLRGESGSLRARVQEPGEPILEDSLPAGVELEYASPDTTHATDEATAPRVAGLWRLAVRVGDALSPVTGFNVITLTPMAERRSGRIGLYYIGTWPTERGVRRAGYVTPTGVIEVTRENRSMPVSDHFTLGDFLTKGQENVWPKYLVLDMRLVDKLELVIQELENEGHIVHRLRVMSGFRTPSYNATGGNPRGRASLSRHMYGDAADVFVDNDGDGWTDDLDGDGKVTLDDASVMARAAERVERKHPTLVGGVGTYAATSAHGPFIHVDTRGYRARWTGTGDS